MRVLAHPDPFVLEAELLDRVAGSQSDDPLAPVLIVVPTSRLVDHVQRRLGERIGAVLGVHVLHYRALAYRILDRTGPGRRRLVSPRQAEALLERVLRELPPNPWTEFIERRPGALAGLMGAVNDLRDAAIAPGQVEAALQQGDRERGLARVYTAYVRELEATVEAGFVDEAGLAAIATRQAAAFVEGLGCREVFHHGAYELIGVHLDLIREIDRAAEVCFLLPAEPGSPATRYAERFADRHLLDRGERLGRIGDRPGGLLGTRLPLLYDEERSAEPLGDVSVGFHQTQGADAEVSLASRQALGAAAAGVPPSEVGILARSLAPYASSLEGAFDDTRLPWSTSARPPLRREPVVHDLVVLLRALAEDFPRAATVELLRSPRIRWEVLLPGESPPAGDLAEVWSRKAGVLGGISAWRRDLAAWVGAVRVGEEASEDDRIRDEKRRAEQRLLAERMVRALEILAERFGPRERSWARHAECLERLVREILPGKGADDSDPGVRGLLDLAGEMREMGELLGDGAAVPFAEMVRWLDHAVEGSRASPRASGGFQVLDFMQARGLTFRRSWVLGMNAGVFPQIRREDTFLPDDARARLVERTGRPLPVRSEAKDEEHLLLSVILGSAQERLEISWQRADETGRARTPSLALREASRVIWGRPDLAAIVEKTARRVPSHPRQWIEWLRDGPGLITPAEEELLVALRTSGPRAAMRALGGGGGTLGRGLAMLRVTESFAPGDLGYDGGVGPGLRAESFGVSSLEMLARCPLQYFFRNVLRVVELEEEAQAFDITPREMGEQVHRVLEEIYRGLAEEKLFESGRPETVLDRALVLLPDAWDGAVKSFRVRLGERVPVLWRQLDRSWLSAIKSFLAADLSRLLDERRRPSELEARRTVALDFGGGVRAEVRGRLDRLLDGPEGSSVGDYKTSGTLDRRVELRRMLRGAALQVPLYWMLNDRSGPVELLAVGPAFAPDSPVDEDRRVFPFPGFTDDRQLQGFLETMQVILSLERKGSFPLHSDNHCGWCAYRKACRRNHPPTLERESHRPDTRDYRDIQKKTQRAPLLADVRGRGQGGDAGRAS